MCQKTCQASGVPENLSGKWCASQASGVPESQASGVPENLSGKWCARKHGRHMVCQKVRQVVYQKICQESGVPENMSGKWCARKSGKWCARKSGKWCARKPMQTGGEVRKNTNQEDEIGCSCYE